MIPNYREPSICQQRRRHAVPWVRALFVGAVLAVTRAPALGQAPAAEVMERIARALPSEPAAKAAAKRKLLVCTRTLGFRHASIPVGAAALAELGKKTGAFEVVHREDLDCFESAELASFDAVCFLNSTGEVFDAAATEKTDDKLPASAAERAARLKKNLLDFVAGGKGLVGIHSATDMFYQWPEYGAMIGGYFDGHPWHEDVVIRNEEPRHPLCAALRGRPLEIKDEIYQLKDPYARQRQRVLLSLDTARCDMTKPGIHRTDADFGVSWIREHGNGRVFYCSLGHRDEIYWNQTVLAHYLAGIQFALGDLKLAPEQIAPRAAASQPARP